MIILVERNLTVPEAMAEFGLSSLRVPSDELKRLYRQLSLQHHPDRNPGRDTAEKMQRINQAYEILKQNLGREAPRGHARPSSSGTRSSARPSGRASSGARDDDLGDLLARILRVHRGYVMVVNGTVRLYLFGRSASPYYLLADLDLNARQVTFRKLVFDESPVISRPLPHSLQVPIPLSEGALERVFHAVSWIQIHATDFDAQDRGGIEDLLQLIERAVSNFF